MKQTRLGIIGAGGIAQLSHIPAFRKIAGVEITALADVNGEKLKHVAGSFDIPHAFTDWRKLVECDLDAVVVCSPNACHAPQSIAAMSAGKHVLCEKPVCLNGCEAEEIFRVSEETGKIFMAGYPRRFSGEARVLKEMIEHGDFGEIYYLKAGWLRRRGIPGLGTWFTSRELAGGGPMMDIGVHALDLLIYLAGAPMPEMVVGSTYDKYRDRAVDSGWPPARTRIGESPSGGMEVEDLASGFVRLDSGATLLIEASWAANIESGFQVEMVGTGAGARMPAGDKPLVVFSESGGVLTDIIPRVPRVEMFQDQAEAFIACVREGRRAPAQKNEIISVTRIIEGIYLSARKGKPVFY